MAICDECGSHDVERKVLGRLVVEECGLCGYLQGDPAAVKEVEDRRAAAELGISTELYGLIEVLDSIPGVKVDRSISAVPGESTPPALFFALHRQGMAVLDRLTRSLVLARKYLSALWTVEATHQGRLLFLLRPRLFHEAASVEEAERRALHGDVRVLRDTLRRDTQLPWWELSGE